MDTNLRPAQPPEIKRKAPHMPWAAITEKLKADAGEWSQLEHSFATDKAARTALSRASKKYGFEYLVTTKARQADGRIAVYIRWASSKGDDQ